jgi:cytochrome c oxidase cbb3-type subunit 3
MKTAPRLLALALVAFASLSVRSACSRPADEQSAIETTTDFHSLFSTHCTGCHGANGSHGPGPHIGSPVYLAFAKPEAISQVIRNGRTGTPMPAFGASAGGPLSDQQVDALVQGMLREWAKPADFKDVKLPPYSEEEALAAGEQPGNSVRGERAYFVYCFLCHGSGEGKSPVGAMATASYLAIASDQVLRTTMVNGRTDLGMPDWRHRPPRLIANQEISDIVAYLRTKRPSYSKVSQLVALQANAPAAATKSTAAKPSTTAPENRP